MLLTNKYVIGVHVMFYEIELFKLYVDGLINLLSTVDIKENITLDFCFNTSQFLETIDTSLITKDKLKSLFNEEIQRLNTSLSGLIIKTKIQDDDDTFYSQSSYRRELNTNYCNVVDYILWGETDSLFPKEAFSAIETLSEYTDSKNIHRYIMCFADRKMWDDSWNPTVHSDYENIPFIDTSDASDNINYAKSPMSIETMNDINSKITDFIFTSIPYPKIDGSCLVLSSDLIKCGVNIPPCFIHNDDESLSILAKLIMGDKYIQYICKNLLKVHARRHPRKRLYVLNEDNPKGFCGKEKGNVWLKFRKLTGENINTLINYQNKFNTYKEL